METGKTPSDQLIELINKLDVDKLIQLAEKTDINRLLETLSLLAESLDSINNLLMTIKKLDESGILASLNAILETSDELFNAMATKDVMKMIGNLMALLYIISMFDQSMLMKLAQTLPTCITKAQETFEKTEKGLGTFELLNLMKSPEMAAMLKALQQSVSCMKSNK